jgi:predicted metalloprotease
MQASAPNVRSVAVKDNVLYSEQNHQTTTTEVIYPLKAPRVPTYT